jgi:hypothetical protein
MALMPRRDGKSDAKIARSVQLDHSRGLPTISIDCGARRSSVTSFPVGKSATAIRARSRLARAAHRSRSAETRERAPAEICAADRTSFPTHGAQLAAIDSCAAGAIDHSISAAIDRGNAAAIDPPSAAATDRADAFAALDRSERRNGESRLELARHPSARNSIRRLTANHRSPAERRRSYQATVSRPLLVPALGARVVLVLGGDCRIWFVEATMLLSSSCTPATGEVLVEVLLVVPPPAPLVWRLALSSRFITSRYFCTRPLSAER